MIKRALFILIACNAVAFADGPLFKSSNTYVQQEFENVYKDIRSFANGTYRSSSMTLQGITVDSATINSQATINSTTTFSNPATFNGPVTINVAPSLTSHKITNLANGTASADAAAYGQITIFQTTAGTLSASSATATTVYAAVGLTQNITMTNSAHRVLITVSGGMLRNANPSSGNALVTVKRDTTDLSSGSGFSGLGGGTLASSVDTAINFSWIDSPNDTNAHTYAVFLKTTSAAVTQTFNVQSQKCSIILQEIL